MTVAEVVKKYLYDENVTVLYVNFDRESRTETFCFSKDGTLPPFENAIEKYGDLVCEERKSGYVIECDVIGKVGEWYEDDFIGGYIREDGTIEVWEEYGLSDEDIDSHAVDVQNGDGYYDELGRYRSYD